MPAWQQAPARADAVGQLAACIKSTRAAAKVWSRCIRAPTEIIHNCLFLIQLFDYYKEIRQLSSEEFQVRRKAQEGLEQAIKARATHWKQRSKNKAIREGDSNTAFHHAQATQRLRHNFIRMVRVEGTEIVNHDGKTAALTSYFRSIMGTPGESVDTDLASLYEERSQPSNSLTDAFSEAETKQVLLLMNRNSAPGPDGFGLAFYRAAWPTVRVQITDFMAAFHRGDAQLESINRSHMVLIPKKLGAVDVDAFSPICLQNCTLKILSKVLTKRRCKMIFRI